MNYLLVGIGGMLGAIARYVMGTLSLQLFPEIKFPIGTLIINLTGCLLIGTALALLERQTAFNNEIRLFVITGVLGGFTTFSAFGAETFYLIQEGRIFAAGSYILLSVLLGVTFVFLGLKSIQFVYSV